MEHTKYFKYLLKKLDLPIELIEVGKQDYKEYGYFTQTYMPIVCKLERSKINGKLLQKMLEHIEFVKDLALTNSSENECLQRTIECSLFYCKLEPAGVLYDMDHDVDNIISVVYEQFKKLDC